MSDRDKHNEEKQGEAERYIQGQKGLFLVIRKVFLRRSVLRQDLREANSEYWAGPHFGQRDQQERRQNGGPSWVCSWKPRRWQRLER